MNVEVVFPDICGAFYKGTLLDLNIDDSKCLVSFENNWKPNSWVSLEHVRFPPAPLAAEVELTTGSKIEAYLPFQDGEVPGWWLATVTKSKGEVAGIQFQSGDRNFTDLVEHKYLRNPNANPPLSSLTFKDKEFTVPEEIQEFCKDIRVHQNFMNKVKALSVSYDEEKKSLVVISDTDAALDKAEVLIDIHFADLTTQSNLRSRTEKAAQRLQGVVQPVQEASSGVYEEKFQIYPECIGFAMGRQGWNVNQARQIVGVISIDFDDYNSLFTIRAETKEALFEARSLLEFTRDIMHIPRDLAGKVIGRGGNVIQQVLDKSRLNNIKVVGDDEAKDRGIEAKGQVPFELLGRKKAIENAKLMLEYHIDHLKEVNTILQSSEEISQKLRESGIDDNIPLVFPRPNPPRGRGRGRGQSGYRRQRPNRRGRGRSRRDEREGGDENNDDNEDGTSDDDEEEEEQQVIEDEQQQQQQQQQQDDDANNHSEGDDTPPVDRRRPQRRGGGRGGRGGGRGGRHGNQTNQPDEIQSQDWPELNQDEEDQPT